MLPLPISNSTQDNRLPFITELLIATYFPGLVIANPIRQCA